MDVVIVTIPHKEQRYETCGDWWWRDDSLQIRVSDTGNWRYDMCVALHELVEALLCKDRGIPEEAVSKFDTESGLDEPGADARAPYHKEHALASGPELTLLGAFGLALGEYNKALEDL